MISIYDLKPKFQNLLRPICNSLAEKGVTANQVTLAALALSLVTGLLIVAFHNWQGIFVLVPLVLFVRMALNAIDGMLAREHNMASPLGALLNELGDVISDTAIYLPFALHLTNSTILIIICVILAILSEMTGVLACQINCRRRYDGPMGKSDRAFVFGLLGLLLAFNVTISPWLPALFVILNLLLMLTIYNRGKKALQEYEA